MPIVEHLQPILNSKHDEEDCVPAWMLSGRLAATCHAWAEEVRLWRAWQTDVDLSSWDDDDAPHRDSFRGLVQCVVASCPQLYVLNVAGCARFGDACARMFSEGACPELFQLDLERTTISDAGLAALASGCQQLNHLYLDSCTCIIALPVTWMTARSKDRPHQHCFTKPASTIAMLAQHRGWLAEASRA